MFGGFGSRFAKFGTGGGGRSIASPADLLQLFKRGSEDGAMIDELDNTTDLKLANVNCLSFDGTDDVVDTGLFANGNFSLEIDFKFNVLPPGSLRIIAGSNDGQNHRFYIGATSNGYQIGYGNGFSSPTGTVDTNRHTLKLEGGNLYLDGSSTALIDESSNSFSGTSTSTIGIGDYGDNSFNNANITVFSVKIKDGSNLIAEYPLAEGSGTKAYDVSGNGNHGTITGATWTTEDGIGSWNHEYGHDLIGVLNGTVSGFDTGIGGDELDMYEIKMQSTGDVGGDGNSYFVENGNTNPTLFMTNSVDGGGRRISFRVPSNTFEQMSGVSSADFNTYKVDYTNTSSVKVFVNGELKLTSTQTVTPTSSHYYIGNDSASGASDNGFFYYFKGWKDGVLKIHAVLDPSGRVRDLVSGNLLTAAVGGTGSLGLKRIPALNTKTKQVATFDGVANKLTAAGITTSSVITHDGTATLTAGTGEITSNAGTAYNIKVDGVLTFTMSTGIGTSTITSENAAIGNASVTVGSGGLESFWGTRIADSDGVLVSADYATGSTSISNPPALDNDSEADLVQTDSVFVSGAANFWSADGAAQDEKTFDELITHANTRNGYHRVWVKVLNGRVLTIAQYDLDKNFLPSEVLKNERYFGGTSAALRDVNGDFITDGSGYVIFAA